MSLLLAPGGCPFVGLFLYSVFCTKVVTLARYAHLCNVLYSALLLVLQVLVRLTCRKASDPSNSCQLLAGAGAR
jgi:hypothetical protein